MKRGGWRLLLAATLLAFPTAPALADPMPYVPIDERQAETPRPVAALLPQMRIASSIELGRIAFPGRGGGALGAIIVSERNNIPGRLAQSAAERGDEWIAPLVNALGGFAAHELAGKATQAALNDQSWLGASPPTVLSAVPGADAEGGEQQPVIVSNGYGDGLFGPAPNLTASMLNWQGDVAAMQQAFAEANPDAEEWAQVLWRYQTSPDFTQVQVIADIEIMRRGETEPSYRQQVISLVRLNRPSFVEEENVARWAANDAALARASLTSAFERAGEVLGHVLALDEAGWAEASDRKRESVTSGGYHGPVLFRDETGPVFWGQRRRPAPRSLRRHAGGGGIGHWI